MTAIEIWKARGLTSPDKLMRGGPVARCGCGGVLETCHVDGDALDSLDGYSAVEKVIGFKCKECKEVRNAT